MTSAGEIKSSSDSRAAWRGVLWMLGAVASFSTMAVVVRELGDTLSIYQILFLRSALGLPMIVGAALMFGAAGLRRLRTANLRLQIIRNVVHIVGQLTWIYGLTVLPLAMVFAVEFTTPLWTVVMAAVILHEYPSRAQKIGLCLGLIGTFIIVRPGPGGVSWDVVIVLFAALTYAAAHLSTRILGRTDSPMAVAFWMCLIQTPLGFCLALIDWRPIAAADIPLLLLLAASGLFAHQCLTAAFRLAPMARVIPVDFLRLPLIATIGALFYAEPLDPFVLAGGAIVLTGVLIAQATRKAAPAPSAPGD
jgi:drug/metabolite transporter (DMT)-like permease